ncbi:MAG: hypothetical protein KKA45_04610 [Alphaproteobacteria bacterium]|nr:hypothetical protein [Alphaproteobacteria bacterium]
MRWLSLEEIEQWLKGAGFTPPYQSRLGTHLRGSPVQFEVIVSAPTDFQMLYNLAAEVSRFSDLKEERLLWLTQVGSYPYEFSEILLELRRGWGDCRGLADAPGMLFPETERVDDDLESSGTPGLRQLASVQFIAFLAMTQSWFGYYVSRESGRCVFFGDEFVRFCLPTLNQAEAFAAELRQIKLECGVGEWSL